MLSVGNVKNTVVRVEIVNLRESKVLTFGSGFFYKIDHGRVYVITAKHILKRLNDSINNSVYVHFHRHRMIVHRILQHPGYDLAILDIGRTTDRNAVDLSTFGLLPAGSIVRGIGWQIEAKKPFCHTGKLVNSVPRFSIAHGEHAFYTDCAMVSGNSGCPVFDNYYGFYGMYCAVDNERPMNYRKCMHHKDVLRGINDLKDQLPLIQEPKRRRVLNLEYPSHA